MEKESLKDIDSLSQALATFNETTFQLQDYYNKLEKQAQLLSEELNKKNKELNRKVIELDETRSYLNNVLESITEGVLAIDLVGKITTVNQAALRMSEFSLQDLIGRHVSLIFPSYDFYQLDKKGEFTIDETDNGIETEMKMRSHESIPVILFPSRILNESGNLIGYVVTFKDLSHIRRLEDQVARAGRLASIGEMAAGVAHEVRNPLGGIEMYASILARDFEEDSSQRNMLEKILEGVHSINRIVSELLNFTKSFNHTRFSKIDLINVVESALSFAQAELKSKEIEVKRHYTISEEFFIHGDSDQLKQLFLNLFLNAAQSIEQEKGVLEISLSLSDSKTEIRIKDNGKGISKEYLNKIFNPFFTTRPDGNGLGLAICHRIIEAHKGDVNVVSQVGKGTEFQIVFPNNE